MPSSPSLRRPLFEPRLFPVALCAGLAACSSPVREGTSGQASEVAVRDAGREVKAAVYKDVSAPVEKRVEDLLARMTPEEKLGQISQRLMGDDAETVWAADLRAGRIGAFLPKASAARDPRIRNGLQRIACEQSRLGIPILVGFDTIHGFRTIFPIPLAQACSWDPPAIGEAAAIGARESSAAGLDWLFAPMCDIGRDARWGRVAEGYGEDPVLTSRYVAAAVTGIQRHAPGERPLAACLKHFAGYGAAEGGRDYNTVEISGTTMRDVYLPSFRAGVNAGAMTVMSAFHSNGAMPASADRRLVTGVLRDEWKFSGFMVSDWTAVEELVRHGMAADGAAAARLAISAGVDMEMVSDNYARTLGDQVREGKLAQAVVDEAVRRILRVKFGLGLFENPYASETGIEAKFLLPEYRAAAREAVRRSCVLLKNDGVLPIRAKAPGPVRLALIGPLGDNADEMLGTWQGQGRPKDVITLAEGLAEAFGRDGVTVVRGVPLTNLARTRTLTDGSVVKVAEAEPADPEEIARAVAAANASDVVVMALGEPRGWSGENASRSELTLTGDQERLFDAVAATGKKIVVVLFAGRPLTLPKIFERADAVLMAWHPGVQAGPGIADLLSGASEPTGRLTVSWPRAVGQIPVHYNHFNTGRPQYVNYRDLRVTPEFPFGHGLGYTGFLVSSPRIYKATAGPGDTVTVAADVSNTGPREGETVVQLYIGAPGDSLGARPVRELREFAHVHLKAGETRAVALTVPAAELGRLGSRGPESRPEPGLYHLWVGLDAAATEGVTLTVTP